MNESKVKIGDTVWYVVHLDREQAEVLAFVGTTHARVRLLTGSQAGVELEAPWGVIQPLTE